MGKPAQRGPAYNDAADRDAAINGLAGVGNDAGLDQSQRAVADRAGVQAQLAMPGQLPEDRIRDCTNTGLQCRPVCDQRGDIAADRLFDRSDFRGRQVGQVAFGFDQQREVSGGQIGPAKGPRHIGMDLSDDDPRCGNRRD